MKSSLRSKGVNCSLTCCRSALTQPKERPLSVGQERLYRLARLDPIEPLYNVAVAYRLKGPLNVYAFEQAVRGIEQRHEILRTTFPFVDGDPVQHIAPPQTQGDVFCAIDLHGADAEADRMGREIQREITRAMDLTKDALWRVALLRLSEQESVTVLTMHHIVTDGWSFDLFLKELSERYRAFDRGAESSLGKLSLQYADYGEQQKESFSYARVCEPAPLLGKTTIWLNSSADAAN